MKEVMTSKRIRHTDRRSQYCQAAGFSSELVDNGIRNDENVAYYTQNQKKDHFE